MKQLTHDLSRKIFQLKPKKILRSFPNKSNYPIYLLNINLYITKMSSETHDTKLMSLIFFVIPFRVGFLWMILFFITKWASKRLDVLKRLQNYITLPHLIAICSEVFFAIISSNRYISGVISHTHTHTALLERE